MDFTRQLLPPAFVAVLRRARLRFVPRAEDREQAELARLRALPSGQEGRTKLPGWEFTFDDGASFAHLYKCFFSERIFDFDAASDQPFIIDCGAHIGVSVAWWKTRYPRARVLAFEADPHNFALLQRNCGHLPGVTLHHAAVWNQDGNTAFLAKGGEGGHIAAFTREPSGASQGVPCARLRSHLAEHCDLLKMDIEGAEVDVIEDCADALGPVARLFVEYHSFAGMEQRLGKLLVRIGQAGFRVHAHVELPSPQPFLELTVSNAKDSRLGLFCFRDEAAPTMRSRPTP